MQWNLDMSCSFVRHCSLFWNVYIQDCNRFVTVAWWLLCEKHGDEFQINVFELVRLQQSSYLFSSVLFLAWYSLYALVQLINYVKCLYMSVTNTKDYATYFGHLAHFILAIYCYISFLFLINVIYVNTVKVIIFVNSVKQ